MQATAQLNNTHTQHTCNNLTAILQVNQLPLDFHSPFIPTSCLQVFQQTVRFQLWTVKTAEKVDKFCYLGDIVNVDEGCDSAVTAGVRCARKKL